MMPFQGLHRFSKKTELHALISLRQQLRPIRAPPGTFAPLVVSHGIMDMLALKPCKRSGPQNHFIFFLLLVVCF